MKLGTPGFQGKRLRQARMALGLTQDSLALMLGCKSVSNLERGPETPSPEVMHRILTVTDQPMSFFTTPVPEGLESSFLFRSMRSLDDVARGMAEASLMWLAEYTRYLSEHVHLPEVNLPDFSDIPSEVFEIEDKHIVMAAQRLREHWGLGSGPLPNLVNLLEANGFVIHIDNHGSGSWDAVSMWDEKEHRPFVLVNSSKESYFRLRFTLAHELCHLLLHRYVADEDKSSKQYTKELERQANLFAGEFALPAQQFTVDVFDPSLDVLRVLKSKWRMSIAAMLFRLTDLNIVDEVNSKRLWANYRRRWREREPLEDTPMEEVTILKSTVALLVEENILTPSSMVSNIPFSQKTQEGYIRMGVDFWNPTPELKVYKMFG